MTVKELQSKLKAYGVRNDAYCLEDDENEAYCLRQSPWGWYVYYSERGMENRRKDFSSESEACEYLLAWILKDPTTH